MAKLYELAEELRAVSDALDTYALEHDDVSEFPLLEKLGQLEVAMEAKCLAIAAWIKNLRSEAAEHAEEKKAQEAMRKAPANKADRLFAYLEGNVPRNAAWKDSRAKLSWAKNPPAVEVTVDIGLIPEKYLKPREVDKEKLKADMLPYEIEVEGPDGEKTKETVVQVRWPGKDGAELVLAEMRQGVSLRIK